MVLTFDKTKNAKGLWVFVAAILLSVVVFFMFVKPKLHEYGLNEGSLSVNQNSYDTVKRQSELANRSIKTIKEQKSNFDKLELALPKQRDVPDVYAHIEMLADAANLTITNLQAQQEAAVEASPQQGAAPATQSDLGIIRLNMTIKGGQNGAQQLQQFLRALGTSLRLIDVETIDINIERASDIFSAQLVLRTYYLK